MDTILNHKQLWISLAILAGLILFSYLSSFVFAFLSGFDNPPMPWDIWLYAYEASQGTLDSTSQSRLSLAFGLPFLGSLFAAGSLHELLKGQSFDFADSKWATAMELKKEGLFANQGVILGKLGNKFIVSNEDSHTIVSARTRTGKGVGIIIPNLLSWRGSAVCLDIKHENFNTTSGFRQNVYGQKVFKWDPYADNLETHGFNPLDQISQDHMDRIRDIRRIAGILLPVEGKDIFWINEARSLFVGLTLYVMDQPDEITPSTIGSVYRLLSAEAELGDICRTVIKEHPELDPAIIECMNRFANKAAKERSGVKSQVDSALTTWQQPKVDAATTKSSFDLRELRKKQISIYVCVKPSDINELSTLLRLFFDFLITGLTMNIPDKETEPHEVLIVLDEMHMLGKMQSLQHTFTLTAGYGCRLIAAVQDYSVLDNVYGKEGRKIIFSNCKNQIYFRPSILDSAREISAMMGNRMVETISYSQKKSLQYEPQTKNVSYAEKPLMPPAKVMKLDNNKGLLIGACDNPVLFTKIQYFKEKGFQERLLPPVSVEALCYRSYKTPKFDIKPKDTPPQSDPNQRSIFEEGEDNHPQEKNNKDRWDDRDDKPDDEDTCPIE